jgi:hypothetical protein
MSRPEQSAWPGPKDEVFSHLYEIEGLEHAGLDPDMLNRMAETWERGSATHRVHWQEEASNKNYQQDRFRRIIEHLLKWNAGIETNEDDLAHAACGIQMLFEFERRKNGK